MRLTKIKNISKKIEKTYDLSVHNNHNFFANNHLIHNSSYRGEIVVMLQNHSRDPFKVTKGMKIAQLVIAPVIAPILIEVDELDDTERGGDGFGSTGV